MSERELDNGSAANPAGMSFLAHAPFAHKWIIDLAGLPDRADEQELIPTGRPSGVPPPEQCPDGTENDRRQIPSHGHYQGGLLVHSVDQLSRKVAALHSLASRFHQSALATN